MRKILIVAMALIIKVFLIYYLVFFSLMIYKKDIPFYVQNPLVWIFIYMPIFMGYETIINVFFTTYKKYKK